MQRAPKPSIFSSLLKKFSAIEWTRQNIAIAGAVSYTFLVQLIRSRLSNDAAGIFHSVLSGVLAVPFYLLGGHDESNFLKILVSEVGAFVESTVVFLAYQIGIDTGFDYIIWKSLGYVLLFAAEKSLGVAKNQVVGRAIENFSNVPGMLAKKCAMKWRDKTIDESLKTVIEHIENTYHSWQRFTKLRNIKEEWTSKYKRMDDLDVTKLGETDLKLIRNVLALFAGYKEAMGYAHPKYGVWLGKFKDTGYMSQPLSEKTEELIYALRLVKGKVGWKEWFSRYIEVPNKKEACIMLGVSAAFYIASCIPIVAFFTNPVMRGLQAIPHLVMKAIGVDEAHERVGMGTWSGDFYRTVFFPWFQLAHQVTHFMLLAGPLSGKIANGKLHASTTGGEIINNGLWTMERISYNLLPRRLHGDFVELLDQGCQLCHSKGRER